MVNKKKYFLLFVAGVVVVGAGAVYYFYNKPAVDVLNADGQKVAAADLYATFATDSVKAKREYTHKILEVSGVIAAVSENQQREPVLLLKTNTEGAAVNCTLEGPARDIRAGSTATIKGICNGIGEGDADLGIMGDVYLVRCYVLK